MCKNISLLDLKKGDIILYPPHKEDWLSQAIAILTDGTVNHAAIYYGCSEQGKPSVVESVLNGLGVNALPDTIDPQYSLRVFRFKSNDDLTPVIEAANYYVEEKDTYPYANLVTLALLLISKRFFKSTLKNRIIYDILIYLSEAIMICLQSKSEGKHPMTCSQLTAQCFTDAGDDYNLQFKNLIISLQLDDSNSECENNNDLEHASLLGITMPECDINTKNDQELNYLSTVKELLSMNLQLESKDRLENNSIADLTKEIIFNICKLVSPVEPKSIEEAITVLKSDTCRNFIVTPEDLNINCTNIYKVGLLSL